MGVGKGNVQVVNVDFLTMFQPGIRAAAARGVSILHAGLGGFPMGVFPTN